MLDNAISTLVNYLYAGSFCMLFCRLIIFENNVLKSFIGNTTRVSDCLDPYQTRHALDSDQARQHVGPELGQKLFAREIVTYVLLFCA